MRKDFDKAVLNVQNGINGEVFTLYDFFKLPSVTQEDVLGSVLLPMIYDLERINIFIGYKD